MMDSDQKRLIGRYSRRDVLGIAAVVSVAAGIVPFVTHFFGLSKKNSSNACQPWPFWDAFVKKHVDSTGRVIDFFNPDLRTTSEGQSYALFFALVNNDIGLFERILSWTSYYLCDGHLGQRLPAWLWGQSDDKQWEVLDDNTASDADLWIAYCLLEAGRLWERKSYTNVGRQLLQLITKTEVIDIPGIGMMLLPGLRGFVTQEEWTLNPSYLPLMALRRCALADPTGPWSIITENASRVIAESAHNGFSPDWIAWNGEKFITDASRGNIGSYDAIRVYLWAGMLNTNDPEQKKILQNIDGLRQLLKKQQVIPEKVDITTGTANGQAPVGFSAALLPYLSVLNEDAILASANGRIPTADKSSSDLLHYYDRMLILFGQGWYEERFRFAADGSLQPFWRISSCSVTKSSH